MELTIAATAGVLVVTAESVLISAYNRAPNLLPGSPDTRRLLYDDEIVTLVPSNQVNGHAHPYNVLVLSRPPSSHQPEIPAPIMTTAALVWSLFPTGTCGHG